MELRDFSATWISNNPFGFKSGTRLTRIFGHKIASNLRYREFNIESISIIYSFVIID